MFEKGTSYIFTDVELTETEFNQLIFMGPPPIWQKYPEAHKFLRGLCLTPLASVVENVLAEVKGHPCPTPQSVFEYLTHENPISAKTVSGENEQHPWFRRHLLLCKAFERELMPPLWIRNLAKNERKKVPRAEGSFYIEDGNHRALVYAVLLKYGKARYEPVQGLHANSWDIAEGILGHSCRPAKALENDGNFPTEGRKNPITKEVIIKKRKH